MSELILHVGTPKTGTTSLQRFLCLNRGQLAEQGVTFPLFPQVTEVSQDHNGHLLARCVRRASRTHLKPFSTSGKAFKSVKRALTSGKTVLLSEECLSEWWFYQGEAATARRTFARTLADLLEAWGVTHTTFVMYLRGQDEFLASLYKQRVRDWQEHSSFESFLQRFAPVGDYAGYIDELERALGPSCSFVVRRYSRDSFVGGSIYSDFFDALGLRWSDDVAVPDREYNPSITFDMAAALLSYTNWDELGQTESRALRRAADDYSKLHPEPPRTTPFSPEARAQLLEGFAQGNRSVEERFLGGAPLADGRGDASRPRWAADPARIGECREYLEAALATARQGAPAGWRRLTETGASFVQRARRFMRDWV